MCDLDKPLVACTLRDFIEALTQCNQQKESPPDTSRKNMPKGIKGIMTIFGCSEYSARKILHSGIIDKAIYTLGARCFVTDAEEARKLYKLNQPLI